MAKADNILMVYEKAKAFVEATESLDADSDAQVALGEAALRGLVQAVLTFADEEGIVQ